jgi:O-antigen ligase
MFAVRVHNDGRQMSQFGIRCMRAWLTPIPFMLLLFVLPFPGTVALRLLCLAIAFAISVGYWGKGPHPTLPDKGVIALWIALALLSLFYAVDFSYSLGEIKNEIGYTMMALFAFFVYCDDKKKACLGAWSVVLALAVISVWSLWLWAHTGKWQEDAGHGGSATYAGFVLMALPAILLVWYWQPSARWLMVGIALIALLATVYSRQRAIWPVLGIEMAFLIILLRYKKGNPLPAARTAILLLLIIATGLTFAIATHSTRLGMAGNAAEMKNDPRLRNWPAVVARIGEQPLIGAGFGRNAMKLGHPDLVPETNYMFWHAHNVFLNYGLALGIPGMFALILLFGSLSKTYWGMYRSGNQELATLGIAGILLVTAVVLRNLSNDFFQRDAALLFWAMNGLFLGYGLRLQRSVDNGGQ